MAKLFDAAEVAKHNTPESCWVILYGQVYDVTDFLTSHPGGSKIILKLAGKDATEDYDPVHPPGTLEENLGPEAKLGDVDPETLPRPESAAAAAAETASSGDDDDDDYRPPLESLLNLDEIEEEATKRMPRKAWAYYFSASDDLVSKTHNSTVYRDMLLRPRVFADCTRCDTSTTLLGHKVGVPFFVAPAAMARLAHPDGERGIAKAAARFGALQIISNNASMTPEQIVKDSPASQTFGWQLYVQNQRDKSEAMLKRIGGMRDRIKFVVLTLDAPVPGKRELDEKSSFGSEKSPGIAQAAVSKPGGGGSGGVGQQLFFGTACDLTWKTTLPWLAQHTDLPIVLKGLQTHEDAYLAAQHAPQVKAIILSNHGGRAMDTAPPAVHTLLEIRKYCPEVLSKVEVWVDGGIRRGTDVVKALCLGAKGVGLGRAPLFGLGAGGQAGVERMFEILEAETATCMRLLGVETISELGPHLINSRRVERDIYNGDAGLDKRGLWTRSKL
ncbi:hypothetical protein C2857_002408 [Epichloe festucae Fl1]|uniref:L-lactate dehydrogenase (cytochrome) n=1 Tax=Epichloe festucae (strain Fl1) TaxID=877507 RepID=A0A7S9PV05_EPIFF|nr:hypothetical protein C2857_002408 [Epichloe festucae Fl1]